MPDRIFLGHTTGVIQASVTRPNDTTPYTSGDVIGTSVTAALELEDVARSNGGSGMIMSALVIDSANQATQPSLELWLFTAPLAVVADNAPFAPTDAEMLTLVGVITLSSAKVGNATVGAGGNLAIVSDVVATPFKCGGGTTNLYGYLVVRNGYTPVADETFTVTLTSLQDY